MEKNERWGLYNMKILLDAVNDYIKDNPAKFEKPVAAAFYNTLKENNVELEKFTWKSMRDKMRYLKMKYKAAIDWRSQTGQGVLEESGEASVKEYILKICPFFDELDEAFGSRANINIQSTFDSEDCVLYEYLDEPSVEDTADVPACVEEAEEAEGPTSFSNFKKQLKTGKREKRNAVDFLLNMREINEKKAEDKMKLEQLRAEENNKLEDRKLKLQEEVENKKLKFKEQREEKKLEIEHKKLFLEDRRLDLQEKTISLKNKELDNAMQLEKYKIDKEFELKALELKLKYGNTDQ